MRRSYFYAAFIDCNGRRVAAIYNSFPAFYSDTFSPDVEILNIIPFSLSGKTYAERKAAAADIVKDFQAADASNGGGLSWAELYTVQRIFKTWARRYGLTAEFKENAII